MRLGKLHIGCPVWACEHWRGSLYTASAPRSAWLQQYSTVFDCVEGNSTFYALPSLETARRWAGGICPGFQFALKLPRRITHDLRLTGAQAELAEFIAVARILQTQGCLGPSFIQLPPDFSTRYQATLEQFLRQLPSDMPWAVEVRHSSWFDEGPNEAGLDALLTALGIDKVLFDSRALFSQPASDAVERESQRRKPQTPWRTTTTAQHPFLRFIGRNQLHEVQPWIDQWASIIAGWLENGSNPYVFTHAPDDAFAPAFARRLHTAIGELLPQLPPLPPWPGEQEGGPRDTQMLLF